MEGETDIDTDGLADGERETETLGLTDGERLGEIDTDTEGLRDGLIDGLILGEIEGENEPATGLKVAILAELVWVLVRVQVGFIAAAVVCTK
ncbi:MAG: hypothetical protein WC803_12905 [Sphingomonas sp.]|jgi:hypothetical protein